MRLKIKIGYFVSYLVVVVGMILSIGKYDKTSVILYTGLFLFSCTGVFYTLKDIKAKISSQDWLRLSGFILTLVGIFIHFTYEIDLKIFLLVLCALLYPQIGYSKTYSKSK